MSAPTVVKYIKDLVIEERQMVEVGSIVVHEMPAIYRFEDGKTVCAKGQDLVLPMHKFFDSSNKKPFYVCYSKRVQSYLGVPFDNYKKHKDKSNQLIKNYRAEILDIRKSASKVQQENQALKESLKKYHDMGFINRFKFLFKR